MEHVALHLQKEANKNGDSEAGEEFGRTAYNRYYYATFLIIRKMVSRFDTKWSGIPHADYPVLLRGKIKKAFKEERLRAQRASDAELVQICNQAVSTTEEIAQLMEKGSATRVVADYQPEIAIIFSKSERFSLQGIDITEAHQWPIKARNFSNSLSAAWNQIRG
jgi:hypothetical protein